LTYRTTNDLEYVSGSFLQSDGWSDGDINTAINLIKERHSGRGLIYDLIARLEIRRVIYLQLNYRLRAVGTDIS